MASRITEDPAARQGPRDVQQIGGRVRSDEAIKDLDVSELPADNHLETSSNAVGDLSLEDVLRTKRAAGRRRTSAISLGCPPSLGGRGRGDGSRRGERRAPLDASETLRRRSRARTLPRMLAGRMMDFPLTLTHLLERARTQFPTATIVSTMPDKSRTRATYADFAANVGRLANALTRLGVSPGDRVATLAVNQQRHLEAYFAIPCIGAVVHTLNLRLHHSELGYIARHGEDSVLLCDELLLPLFEQFRADVPSIKTVIVLRAPGAASRAPLPAGARVRVPEARRERRGDALLHVRHDRQPEGCTLQSSLVGPARTRDHEPRRDGGRR
jgi:hypothetical protein